MFFQARLKYKKPKRQCIFCGKYLQQQLARHYKQKHKNEERVKSVLERPKKEQLIEFTKLKKEGIRNHNIREVSEQVPNFQREHAPKCSDTDESNLKMCGICFGFYETRFISRHKCQENTCKTSLTLPLKLLNVKSDVAVSLDFRKNILENLRSDSIGLMCREDEIILTVGVRLYDKLKRKADKAVEVRKSVRNDMRRLARLYTAFKQQPNVTCHHNNAMDMFNRVNFDQLRGNQYIHHKRYRFCQVRSKDCIRIPY